MPHAEASTKPSARRPPTQGRRPRRLWLLVHHSRELKGKKPQDVAHRAAAADTMPTLAPKRIFEKRNGALSEHKMR